MRKIIAVVIGLAISQLASATKIYQADISEIYAKSDLVLFGKIESGRVLANDCGVEYVIRVEAPYKGKVRPGALIKFRNSGPTQLGSDYFLFLSLIDREFSPVLSTNSGATNMQAQYTQRCKPAWPPFVVNAFGNGALKSIGTYNENLRRAVLFDDGVLKPPKGLKVTTLGPYDRYDTDKDDTALDLNQFMGYLKSLSSDP